MSTVNNLRAAATSQRIALKLNQTEVAKLTGVSRKWLSEFESGKSNVELGLVLRLLDTLGLEFQVKSVHATHSGSGSVGSTSNTEHDNSSVIKLVKINLDDIAKAYK